MAKTKIRRSLFVGLGGTGMRTLLYLKKMFVDTYGEVPPMIGFLGVDTDKGEFSKELEPKSASSVGIMRNENSETILFVKGTPRTSPLIKLDPIEQMRITVDHPRDIFNVRKDSFGWLASENTRALISLSTGAGQVRTNGRFALISNNAEVESKVRDALSRVARIDAVDNPKYELIDSKTDIYLVFSLGGGTGCGTFIDMAYLIRRCAPDSKVAGYGLLPKVFRTKFQNEMERVMPNGYGAMQDLDWLMCRDWNDVPVKLPIQDGRYIETQDHPFSAVIFVDNENRNNDIYRDNAQLEEMIALSLITSVGELSVANTSVLDNLAVSSTGGSFDVEKKQAWASGMGVCEALIRTDELRKIYAHNVAIYLANNLQNKPVDLTEEILQWIDSPSVKIREHDADDLLDYLLQKEPTPMPSLDKDDYEDAMRPVEYYISSQQPSTEELDEKLQLKIAQVSDELRKFIISTINRKQGAGVGAAEEIINGIESQVKIYLKEMMEEIAEQKESANQFDYAIVSRVKELKDTASSALSIFSSQKKRDLADSICNMATECAACKREIARHDKAITFFNDLLVRLNNHRDNVRQIREKLSISAASSHDAIAKIRSDIGKNAETFQYDLTARVLSETVIDESMIQISDFINNLSGNKVYDFADMETSTTWKYLLDFSYNMPHAKEIGDKDINDILNSMNQADFDELVRRLVAKASPLLPHNFHGYRNGKPAVNYYIGVSDFELSRLKKDDYFKMNILDAADVNFSKIGMKDRLIIFSQMSPIPPFAISSMEQCKAEYDNPSQTINFHIDSEWLKEMRRQGYTMEPGGVANDSLEIWVKGLIFGYIKNENNMYMYLDEENGDFLDDYWVTLAQYRDDAFRKFEEVLASATEQFNKKITALEKEHGAPFVRNIISDAKNNYWEKYSQIGYSKKELKDSHLKGTADQIKREIEFVKNLDIQ